MTSHKALKLWKRDALEDLYEMKKSGDMRFSKHLDRLLNLIDESLLCPNQFQTLSYSNFEEDSNAREI
jgi:hypothetical protein